MKSFVCVASFNPLQAMRGGLIYLLLQTRKWSFRESNSPKVPQLGTCQNQDLNLELETEKSAFGKISPEMWQDIP